MPIRHPLLHRRQRGLSGRHNGRADDCDGFCSDMPMTDLTNSTPVEVSIADGEPYATTLGEFKAQIMRTDDDWAIVLGVLALGKVCCGRAQGVRWVVRVAP